MRKWIGCKDDGINPVQYWGIKPVWIFWLGTIFRKQPINLMLSVEGWDLKFRVEYINPVHCWWITSHAQVFLMVYRDHNQVELKAILYSHTKANDVRLLWYGQLQTTTFQMNEELEIFDELKDRCEHFGICSLIRIQRIFLSFVFYCIWFPLMH